MIQVQYEILTTNGTVRERAEALWAKHIHRLLKSDKVPLAHKRRLACLFVQYKCDQVKADRDRLYQELKALIKDGTSKGDG